MIRLATPADLGAIRACAEAAYARYIPRIGRRPAPMDADYATLIADGCVWVAGDGAALAYAAFWPLGDHLYLDAIAVLPEAAGQGLGRALMDHAEGVARAQGLGAIRLYTNAAMTENLTLYPYLGFNQTGRRVTHGFDRVYFEKRL
jgi:ribosomal protein S18 acetylase RimI-like enzyme